jgi:hypothetical protein
MRTESEGRGPRPDPGVVLAEGGEDGRDALESAGGPGAEAGHGAEPFAQIPGPAGRSSVSGIAFGYPVVATFLEFLLQNRECGPVGLICLAVDLHRAVVRRGERILRYTGHTAVPSFWTLVVTQFRE